jgi:hypothetical protein
VTDVQHDAGSDHNYVEPNWGRRQVILWQDAVDWIVSALFSRAPLMVLCVLTTVTVVVKLAVHRRFPRILRGRSQIAGRLAGV